MNKYDGLSDEELLKLLLKMSPETLEEFSRYDKLDAQLLAFNLREMDRKDEEDDSDA